MSLAIENREAVDQEVIEKVVSQAVDRRIVFEATNNTSRVDLVAGQSVRERKEVICTFSDGHQSRDIYAEDDRKDLRVPRSGLYCFIPKGLSGGPEVRFLVPVS